MSLVGACDLARRAVFLQQFHDGRLICRPLRVVKDTALALAPFLEHILERRADLGFNICSVPARQMLADLCNIFIDQVHFDFLMLTFFSWSQPWWTIHV